MSTAISKGRTKSFYRLFSVFIAFTFTCTTILPPSYAQTIGVLNLPVPGTMVPPSPAFVPVLLKGMTIHPENPLQFDFIVDSGNTNFKEDQIKTESQRLVKYFLASMTIPKDDLWVNLSPYESDKIIPEELGKTELGRDMLAQDYILKQLTASLMYPEKELGKEFWDRVYKKAEEQFGTSEIPVNTFNKVWILPDTATVYEHGQTVYIVEAKLKVMLEEDYIASGQLSVVSGQKNDPNTDHRPLSTEIIREIILPEIEKEVNEGKNFAPLRQIYHSLILAKWYKETIKESLLSKVYVDQKKIAGVDIDDVTLKDQIYAQYMEAYKKGVFNYIKEDYDRLSNETIPRKYFSGGEELTKIPLTKTTSGSPIKGDGFLGKGVKLFVALTLAGSLYQSPTVFAQLSSMPPIEKRSVYNPATGQTSEVWVTPDLDEFIPGPKFLDFIIKWLSQPDSLGIGWSLEVKPLLGLTFENENLIRQVSELKDEEIKGTGIEYLSSIGFYVKYEYKGKEYFRSLKGNSYVILPQDTEKLGEVYKSRYPIIVELSSSFLKRQLEFIQGFGMIRNSKGNFIKLTKEVLEDILLGKGGHLEYRWNIRQLSVIYNNGEKARFWFGKEGAAFEKQFFSNRIGFIRREGQDSVELTAEDLEKLIQKAGDSIDPYYDGVTGENLGDPRSSRNLVVIIDKNKVSLDLGDEGRKIVNKFLRTREPWKSDLKPSSSPLSRAEARALIEERLASQYPDHPEYKELITDETIDSIAGSKRGEGRIDITYYEYMYVTEGHFDEKIPTNNPEMYGAGYYVWREPSLSITFTNRIDEESSSPVDYEREFQDYKERTDKTFDVLSRPREITEDSLRTPRQKFRSNFEKGELKDGVQTYTAIPEDFEGVTAITWVNDKATEEKIAKLQGEIKFKLERAGLGQKIAFVNPGSFHVTIHDLIVKPGNDDYDQQKDRILEGVQRAFNELGAIGDINVEVKGVGMIDVTKVLMARVYPKTLADFGRIYKIKQEISQYTGIDIKPSFVAHITLGYFVNPLNQEEYRRLLEIINETTISDLILGEYFLGKVSFAEFPHLNEYWDKDNRGRTVLSYNPQNGAVGRNAVPTFPIIFNKFHEDDVNWLWGRLFKKETAGDQDIKRTKVIWDETGNLRPQDGASLVMLLDHESEVYRNILSIEEQIEGALNRAGLGHKVKFNPPDSLHMTFASLDVDRQHNGKPPLTDQEINALNTKIGPILNQAQAITFGVRGINVTPAFSVAVKVAPLRGQNDPLVAIKRELKKNVSTMVADKLEFYVVNLGYVVDTLSSDELRVFRSIIEQFRNVDFGFLPVNNISLIHHRHIIFDEGTYNIAATYNLQATQSSPSTEFGASGERSRTTSSPIQEALIETLVYRQKAEDELHPGDVDVIMLPGNDDLHVYDKVLDLLGKGIGEHLLISGGVGRLRDDILKAAHKAGFTDIPKTTEAEMIRGIMIQMAERRQMPEAARRLKDDDFVILEKEARYTVENFILAKKKLREKGLLAGGRQPPLRILYIQKPLQQLRTAGQFNSVFADEQHSGEIQGINFTIDYTPDQNTPSDIVGEYFRIIINALKIDPQTQRADWEFPGGLESIPLEHWANLRTVFNSLSADRRIMLRDIMQTNMRNLRISRKTLMGKLSEPIRNFAMDIGSVFPSGTGNDDIFKKISTWRIPPYWNLLEDSGEVDIEEVGIADFEALSEISDLIRQEDAPQRKKLLGSAQEQTEKLRVLRNAIKAFGNTTLGRIFLGDQDHFKLEVQIKRNIYTGEKLRDRKYILAEGKFIKATTENKGVLILEEAILGNGKKPLKDDKGKAMELEAAKALLVQSQLYHMALAYFLRNVNGISDQHKEAFIILKELEFIYGHPARDELIRLLETDKSLRINDPFLDTLKNYRHMRLYDVDNEVLIPEKEIKVINHHLERIFDAQLDRKGEKEDFIKLHQVLGDLYSKWEDYQNALRQYSHGLFYAPHDPTFRAKVVETVKKSVAKIKPSDIEDFKRIWKEPSSRVDEMFEEIKEITLISELANIPESKGKEGKVATRLDQVEAAVTFLSYLDNFIELNPSIEDSEFYQYLNNKRLQTKDLNYEAVMKFAETYRIVAQNDPTGTNDSTKKILRLSAILLQYSRILHGDESLDARLILPDLLGQLGLSPEENEQIMALTSLHRNFGTLHFGEGSPHFTKGYFGYGKSRHRKEKAGQSSAAAEDTMAKAGRRVDVKEDAALKKEFIDVLDSKDVYGELLKFGAPPGPDLEARSKIFQLMEFLKYLAHPEKGKFKVPKKLTIYKHMTHLVHFLSLIEKGDDQAYQELNNAKDGRLFKREVFDTYHRIFMELLGTQPAEIKRNRRLFYLVALFHDAGEYQLSKGETHEELGTVYIKQIIDQLGLFRGESADEALFSEEDIQKAMWLTLSHVDPGTIRFGERTIQKLYENAYGLDPQDPAYNEKYMNWMRSLMIINSADVFATNKGLAFSPEQQELYAKILEDPQYLEERFGDIENYFDYRIQRFSMNPAGYIDRAKFESVKAELAKIKSDYPADYDLIKETFGNPKKLKFINYVIHFVQALRGKDLVRLMYLITVMVNALENEHKPLDRVEFVAKSALAPFSAEPVNEILKNYELETIHKFTERNKEGRLRWSSDNISKHLEANGNLDMYYDGDSRQLFIDNAKLANYNRYLKMASIIAAAWLISKARPVTTDNHIESLVFLPNLTKLPIHNKLEQNWNKIRLLLGMFGEQRIAVNLEKASDLFEGLTLEETVKLMLVMVSNPQEDIKGLLDDKGTGEAKRLMEGLGQEIENLGNLTREEDFKTALDEKVKNKFDELKRVISDDKAQITEKPIERLRRKLAILQRLNENDGLIRVIEEEVEKEFNKLKTEEYKMDRRVNKDEIRDAKHEDIFKAVERVMGDEELRNNILIARDDIVALNKEFELIRGLDASLLDEFEDFLSRINIKNGIWNIRRGFADKPSLKRAIFRMFYVLFRLSRNYEIKNRKVDEEGREIGPKINIVKFSHEIKTGEESETTVLENILKGLPSLSPRALEDIIGISRDPEETISDRLGLTRHIGGKDEQPLYGILFQKSAKDVADTIFIDLRSEEELKMYGKIEKDRGASTSSSPVGESRQTSDIPSPALGTPAGRSHQLVVSGVEPQKTDHGKLTTNPGGIDMNAIDLDREGAGVDIRFDTMELQGIIDAGIDGFAPVIINITPLPSILPLLGLDPANKEEQEELVNVS